MYEVESLVDSKPLPLYLIWALQFSSSAFMYFRLAFLDNQNIRNDMPTFISPIIAQLLVGL